MLRWYRKVCEFQHTHLNAVEGGVYQALMIGAVRAYLGLAYDLYLCAHNAELPELLLKRLRNAQTFEGALYEAHVIGSLAKAGFHIELEDESDSTRSHCELTATHKDTKRRFSVEAKAVASHSSRAGASVMPPRVRGKLFDALGKRADYDRLIFVELNRAAPGMPGEMPDWVQNVDAELAQAEKELTIGGRPAPPAYVFVTNRGFVHALDSTAWTEVGFACGFKIPDFASRRGAQSILELAKARDRHIEMHWLQKALCTYSIPNTFDDRLPEQGAYGDEPRLQIGSTYLVPNERNEEVSGLLVDACVLELERAAYGIYRLEHGEYITCKTPLTDAELEAYRRSPKTFFGVIQSLSPQIREPLDCYDFYWEVYGGTRREKLLEFMSDWPNFATLSSLEQQQLAQAYCARMAEDMWYRHRSAARSHAAE